jgi:putative MATE family efflux protein
VFVLISLVVGVTSGFTIVIAQFYGAKQMENIRRAKDTMNIVVVVSSLTISLVTFFTSRSLFRLMNIPEEILDMAVSYFNIYVAGILFTFVFHSSAGMLRGLGDSVTPLRFLVFACFANIVLDLLFILGFGWGVEGAAWATFIAQFLVTTGLLIYMGKTKPLIRFNFLHPVFDLKLFKTSVNIGLPTGIQQTFVALSGMMLMGLVALFGTDTLAAYTAAGRIESLALMPAMSFGAALSAFTGQNLGAKRPHRVRQGLRATLIIASLFSLGCTLIMIFFGKYIMTAFATQTEQEVIFHGSQYLLITGAGYLLFSTMFCIMGVMRGAGDTFTLMLITFATQILVRVPLAWALSQFMGQKGIWWAIPISWGMGCLAMYIYYRTGRWKKKVIV